MPCASKEGLCRSAQLFNHVQPLRETQSKPPSNVPTVARVVPVSSLWVSVISSPVTPYLSLCKGRLSRGARTQQAAVTYLATGVGTVITLCAFMDPFFFCLIGLISLAMPCPISFWVFGDFCHCDSLYGLGHSAWHGLARV